MTSKATALTALSRDLQAIEAGAGPDSDAAQVLDAVINYLDSTQPTITGAALAEVAWAFLAGYEHATDDTDATRPAYRALRSSGLTV